jgi:hypothetical protein
MSDKTSNKPAAGLAGDACIACAKAESRNFESELQQERQPILHGRTVITGVPGG